MLAHQCQSGSVVVEQDVEGNGSLNGICFIRGSGEREGHTAVRSLSNPREPRG